MRARDRTFCDSSVSFKTWAGVQEDCGCLRNWILHHGIHRPWAWLSSQKVSLSLAHPNDALFTLQGLVCISALSSSLATVGVSRELQGRTDGCTKGSKEERNTQRCIQRQTTFCSVCIAAYCAVLLLSTLRCCGYSHSRLLGFHVACRASWLVCLSACSLLF